MNRIKIVLKERGIKQTWLAEQSDKVFNQGLLRKKLWI